ncbi:hypothetical protein MMC25_003962 [Agyrium rufum]|nr:hypothetical protein [Agyrium rufum]
MELGEVKSKEHLHHDRDTYHGFRATETQRSFDRDKEELARLGKKQVLKRNFATVSMLGFSCIIMATWEGELLTFLIGFQNGGPAGLVYGYIMVWIGTMSIYVVLGELASMAPISGGQYHWVSMLAPRSSQKFFSYITGWVTYAGWQAAVGAAGFLVATLIQGLIVLNNPSYVFERWHGTLIYWAIMLLAVFINTVISSAIPKIEGVVLALHILGFFAIVIPLTTLAPHSSPSQVFTVFSNGGDWSSQGVSLLVGSIGHVFAFVGADAAVHMSEEISNASTVVPRSIIISMVINGLLGIGMLVAVLFCIGDLESALNSPTGFPFVEIFYQASQSAGGTSVMVSIVIVLAWSTTIGALATTSRMIWAFSRDHGMPGWVYLGKVDRRRSMPINAIILTTTIACLLGIVNIASTTAFNDIVSLTVSGLLASYLIVCSLLLWRRCTTPIHTRGTTPVPGPHSSTESYTSSTGVLASPTDQKVTLTWGPFHVPGLWGIAINAFAVAYMLLIFFFSFWPASTPVAAADMNYSVLILGSVVLFSVVYYVVWARKVYKGPIVEIEDE